MSDGTYRATVPGLPATFRFHDLRHCQASLLISSGADVKILQARLRRASAKTTLDTNGHLWPDSHESARAAIGKVTWLVCPPSVRRLGDNLRTR